MPQDFWSNAIFSVTPTVLVGLIFWFVMRAILRAGAWELAQRADVPVEVVIDEYVELAKAFFDPTEAGFINAALDAIAGDVRKTAS